MIFGGVYGVYLGYYGEGKFQRMTVIRWKDSRVEKGPIVFLGKWEREIGEENTNDVCMYIRGILSRLFF